MKDSLLWIFATVFLSAPLSAQVPDRPGPWDFDLALFESRDGLTFERRRLFVERGGVPTLLADHTGQLLAAFQWFPADRPQDFDRVAVVFSQDDGRTWTPPEPIVVEGLPDNFRRPFDPTLVELPDGRYRLYFTSHEGKGRRGPAFGPGGYPGIYSAISFDAVHYRFESGARFRLEGEMVIDCAVALLGDSWHLFAPVQKREGAAYHAVSKDGLKFQRLPNLTLPAHGAWLGCAVPTRHGLRFYGSGRGEGWAAFSPDGDHWEIEPAARWPGGADPGVSRTRSGSYLMVATDMARGRRRPAPAPPSRRRPHPGDPPPRRGS